MFLLEDYNVFYKNNPCRYNITTFLIMYIPLIYKKIEENVKFDMMIYNFVKQDIPNLPKIDNKFLTNKIPISFQQVFIKKKSNKDYRFK